MRLSYQVKWSDKDKYMISLIRGVEKMVTINLFIKWKQSHRCKKQT